MSTPYKNIIDEIVENINITSKFNFEFRIKNIFKSDIEQNTNFIVKHNIDYTLHRKYSENDLQDVYNKYNI